MASKELQVGNNTQPLAPASGPLPQYTEMILEAIDALNEKDGSNKSSISKQIEATYPNLPPAHSTLLTHHLNRMKLAGQLVLNKNNYLKPDPNAPPRRGRGRPPKPKTPLASGIVLPPPRPRGRPPKSLDPIEPRPLPKIKATSTAASLSGRKRGRPPKAASGSVGSVPPASPPASSGAPRGRGRPPKVKPFMTAPVGA